MSLPSLPNKGYCSLTRGSELYKRCEGPHGRGLFATRPIEPGAPLLTESPLVFVPNVLGMLSCTEAIDRVFEKYPVNSTLRQLGCKDIALFATCQLLLQSKTERKCARLLRSMTIAESYSDNNREDDLYVSEIAKITNSKLGDVHSAAAKVRTHGCTVKGHLVECPIGYALFEVAGLMNHSCDANSVVYFNVDGTIVVLARRFIDVGEELTWSYLNGLEHLSVRSRRKQLLKFCNFTCKCERCRREAMSSFSFEDAFDVAEPGVGLTDKDRRLFLIRKLAIEKAVNPVYAVHSSARLKIHKSLFFDARKLSKLLFDLFGFVPSEPFSYQATCLLLYVVQNISAVLSTETTFYERKDLVRLAYSLLFRKSELMLLPTSVSGYLIYKSLTFATVKDGPFCEDYGAIMEHLLRQKDQDFKLLMTLFAFGPSILGKESNASLLGSIRSQVHGISRGDLQRDFFAIDLSCSRALELVAKRNKKMVDESSAEKSKVRLPRLKEMAASAKVQCLVSAVAPARFKFSARKDSVTATSNPTITAVVEFKPSSSTLCGHFPVIGCDLSTANFVRTKK